MTKIISITDGNNKIWNSGFANYIMDNFKWWNTKYGFKAVVPIEFNINQYKFYNQ